MIVESGSQPAGGQTNQPKSQHKHQFWTTWETQSSIQQLFKVKQKRVYSLPLSFHLCRNPFQNVVRHFCATVVKQWQNQALFGGCSLMGAFAPMDYIAATAARFMAFVHTRHLRTRI